MTNFRHNALLILRLNKAFGVILINSYILRLEARSNEILKALASATLNKCIFLIEFEAYPFEYPRNIYLTNYSANNL